LTEKYDEFLLEVEELEELEEFLLDVTILTLAG